MDLFTSYLRMYYLSYGAIYGELDISFSMLKLLKYCLFAI
jgi:hypothetical protein